jgi:hypothetical protein
LVTRRREIQPRLGHVRLVSDHALELIEGIAILAELVESHAVVEARLKVVGILPEVLAQSRGRRSGVASLEGT